MCKFREGGFVSKTLTSLIGGFENLSPEFKLDSSTVLLFSMSLVICICSFHMNMIFSFSKCSQSVSSLIAVVNDGDSWK